MIQFSDKTQSILERQKAQEQQAENDRAVVTDLAKALGSDGLTVNDHVVKQVKKLLADSKAQQDRIAAAKASGPLAKYLNNRYPGPVTPGAQQQNATVVGDE